jgi:hypothetical protein
MLNNMVLLGVDPRPLGFAWAALEPRGGRYLLLDKGRVLLEDAGQVLQAGQQLLQRFPGARPGVELLGEYLPQGARVAALYRTAYTVGGLLALGYLGVPSSGPLSWRRLLLGKGSFLRASEADRTSRAILERLVVELPRSNSDERDAMMVGIALHRLWEVSETCSRAR